MFCLLSSQALPEAEAWDSFQGWGAVCLTCGLPGRLCKAWDSRPGTESELCGHRGLCGHTVVPSCATQVRGSGL